MGSRPEIGAAVADSDVGSALLEVRGATAGYGTLTVLRNISLTVVPKSVVAILGPNGAGKTTLMRLMTGIIKPTIGQVFLGGEDVSFSPPHVRSRQGFCHIPEGRGIFPSLTVRENLLMAYPKSKGDEVDPISQSIEVLPELGIRLRQIAGSLSGGEQQMLAFSSSHREQCESGGCRRSLAGPSTASCRARVQRPRTHRRVRNVCSSGRAVRQSGYRVCRLCIHAQPRRGRLLGKHGRTGASGCGVAVSWLLGPLNRRV